LATPPPIEPAYVLDTHALIWYLKQDRKLGRQASLVFAAAERGDTTLIIPAIVIYELYFADQQWKLFDNFNETYASLKSQPYFHFFDLRADDATMLLNHSVIPEMHDRIIAGTGRLFGVPVITSDAVIFKSNVARTVWK
jgi:PIN domain nuclease of toxin-antitoxin system